MELNKSEIRYLQLPNSETYAYHESGNSERTLLLLHGNLSTSFYFESVIPTFAKQFRVIAPDLRGFGLSTCHKFPEEVDDLVSDINEFMDKLGIIKFSVLGWSLGGGIAMKLAARHPEKVDKVILMHGIDMRGFHVETEKDGKKTRAITFEEVRNTERVKVVEEALEKNDREQMKKSLKKTFFCGRNEPSETQWEAFLDQTLKQKSYARISYILNRYNISLENNGICEGTGEIKKIMCPILVLYGDKDPTITLEKVEENMKMFGDKAKLESFKDCGHYVIIDDQEGFLKVAMNFLSD